VSAVALAGLRGLFVEARPRAAAGPVPPPAPPPVVAVLCTAERGPAAAAAVALALARAAGRRCALVSTVLAGAEPPLALPATPSAARVARRLRERGQAVSVSGRLVRLGVPPAASLPAHAGRAASAGGATAHAGAIADPRGAAPAGADAASHVGVLAETCHGRDAAGIAAAAGAALGRAATAAGAPAALAIPFPRVAGLDRVLAWHDGIVVVREPSAPQALVDRALASLRRLGRPVATLAPAGGALALAAALGLHAPPSAHAAVAELGLFDAPESRP